jgi:glycogen debranching enzyme
MPRALIRPDLLCAWTGPALLITTFDGQCGEQETLSGFYHREARFLRTCRLEFDGHVPWLCEAAAISSDELQFNYVYPELHGNEGGGTGQSGDDVRKHASGMAQRALEIRLTYRVTCDALQVRARITNRSAFDVNCELAWILGADFADIQEAQARRRDQNAEIATEATSATVTFTYGHRDLPFKTIVTLGSGTAWQLKGGRLIMPLALGRQAALELDLSIQPDAGPAFREALPVDERTAHRDNWRATFTRIESAGNATFAEALASNIADFGAFPMLEGPRDEWLALQAGVPAYPAFFGRDALTAGWQAAMVDRGQALDAALTKLGRMQSDRLDDWHDEQPGRIPYQVRRGPLAILNLNPYAAYYADYASPLMYVISLANLFAWTGDRDRLNAHWDTARRILDWAREYGDADRDGYLEYLTRSSKGTKNQGWKDSGDAIVYDDGSPVAAPIATCELQGYWYAAQQLMGVLCAARGDLDDSRAHFASAADLKARFNRDWWSEREQCVALAMDPGKRLVEAVTSNVGHCIAAGIVDDDHLPAAVGRLFAPDMFSGWGVRTLSSDHSFYDPLSYHRGSVWAVEQATLLFGLRRFGFDARAMDIAGALFDLARLYPQYRIPETVGGYPRAERPTPGAYPQANTPQLWNATAFPLLVQTVLGMVPWAPMQLLMIDPVLPAWLPDLTIDDLRVGDARVSLRFTRDERGSTDYEILHRHGTLRVVRQPPPESLTARATDRVTALLSGVLK